MIFFNLTEFNFVMLHYLKKSPYHELAESLEKSLISDDNLPKKYHWDGTISKQSYKDLVCKNTLFKNFNF